ncbi:peptidase S41 family protein, partial [Lepidopterella palustris CBS 459.81]
MRFLSLLATSSLLSLISLASAQAAASSIIQFTLATNAPTQTGDIQPSVTETVSGPVGTASACAQIAGLVGKSRLQYPSVEAEVDWGGVLYFPIDTDAASITIESLRRMLQYQSTLTYLKNPPSGYANSPVDLVQGLEDIGNKVTGGQYNDEYTFESDISALLGKAHDGHLAFDGMAFNGVFRWRRSRQIALISGSQDGGIPKIWAVQDFNTTGVTYTPSEVTQIQGQDAVTFLEAEAELSTYHDPDTRWNSMFYMQSAESYGYFTNPRYYPGPTLNVTFANGTTFTYTNAAVVLDPSSWSQISDGETFYETYITPSTSNSKLKKRDPNRLPTQLKHPRDPSLARRDVPIAYPKPFIQHSSSTVPLAGYFLSHPNVTNLGVLMMQTFNTESVDDAEEFQLVVQNFLAEAVSRGTKKLIIDVRTNGGGKIFLGYDTFKQFFPSTEPQLQSRYRAHDATNVLGKEISTLQFNSRTGEVYTSPFNYHSYLTAAQKPFGGWTDLYGPTTFNADNFTNLLRYNLTDPLTTSSQQYSIGITITGYNDRANFTKSPFAAEDIIILSDGICASTCSLFTEMMVQEANVRTLAIGGRPRFGPMQSVGGTKGSLVLQAQYLTSLSAYVLEEFATTRQQVTAWEALLLPDFGINVNDATVNFQDNIRKGLESAGSPTQFINDTAACRVWYTNEMYLNVSQVWSEVADVVWGNGGKLDEGRCVPGSGTQEQAVASSVSAGATATATGVVKPTKSSGAVAGMGRGS